MTDDNKPARARPHSTGARKASAKSPQPRPRVRACRRCTSTWSGGNDAEAIDQFTRDLAGFHKADSVHYDALLHGCIREAAELDALILPLLDRKLAEISPIEHAVMWIGAYEFLHCAGRALARGAQRMHRAGQGVRRHRRPQVRQRRAQRPGAAAARRPKWRRDRATGQGALMRISQRAPSASSRST